MARSKLLSTLAAALLTASAQPAAEAQFGVMNLPRDDFTWMWGRTPDTARRGASDFTAGGGEAGFRCNLVGKMRLGSRYTRSDIRQLENELRSSMAFIQYTANMMNVLDQRREIEWATLECTKPQAEPDEEREQQRLDRARERMIEEQRRRRERQQE
jgi:hypothetical protein